MPCDKSQPDYLCIGWRNRTEVIRERDDNKCRGCNRSAEVVRLEVHHRKYGPHGKCGECILTGVTNDDLTTLCVECHDAITNVRRNIRYANKEHKPEIFNDPEPKRTVTRIKTKITATITEEIKIRSNLPQKRKFF